MQIKIKRIENGKLPEYKTEGAAGADCYARISEKVIVKPKTVETIPLGFSVEVPEGYEMQIRGRSGNARKNWVQVFNSPGTIDSDYRGEVGAILYNASDKDFEVNPGDRIAQAIIAPVIKAEWYLTDKLSETDRGEGGFGSTGVGTGENKKMIGIEVEANLSMTKKFYEPFNNNDMSNLESILGKEVIIGKLYNATFVRIVHEGLKLRLYFRVTGTIKDNIDISGIINPDIEMDTVTAFERVRINGHRFGKEIEFDEK